MSEKKYARQDRWIKENLLRIHIKINKKTETDIVSVLDRIPNKQGFIKDAIRYYVTHGCPQADVPTEDQILLALKRITVNTLSK